MVHQCWKELEATSHLAYTVKRREEWIHASLMETSILEYWRLCQANYQKEPLHPDTRTIQRLCGKTDVHIHHLNRRED